MRVFKFNDSFYALCDSTGRPVSSDSHFFAARSAHMFDKIHYLAEHLLKVLMTIKLRSVIKRSMLNHMLSSVHALFNAYMATLSNQADKIGARAQLRRLLPSGA